MASSVDAKLLRATKFPPEFNQKVDMQKVNIQVMKKWIASKISEILGSEDDVVIELCFNLIEGAKFPDIKSMQIQLTGFLDKDTAPFCKELWNLCLSAQSSPQGVPKELLEAKKLELIQEKPRKSCASDEKLRNAEIVSLQISENANVANVAFAVAVGTIGVVAVAVAIEHTKIVAEALAGVGVGLQLHQGGILTKETEIGIDTYRRAVVEDGKVPDEVDRLLAQLHLTLEPLFRLPARARGRGRGQLVTRSADVSEDDDRHRSPKQHAAARAEETKTPQQQANELREKLLKEKIKKMRRTSGSDADLKLVNPAMVELLTISRVNHALTAAVLAATPQPASAAAADRATWLWDATTVQDSAAVSDLLAFAGARGVSRIYVGANADVPNAAFGAFVEQCGARGIAVAALIGNPQWVLDQGSPSLDDNLAWIEQYQASVGSGGARFAEVHVDIEPWALDGWDTPATQAKLVAAWQAKMRAVASFGHGLNMTVGADLPFWANTIQAPSSSSASETQTQTTMDAWTLGVVDSATFMTYRSDPAQLLDIAAPALAAGDDAAAGTGAGAGGVVWLAVETTDVGDSTLSYYGASADKLSADLDTIRAGAETHAGFAGIAVHDTAGWQALR
ncbi:hypothetical protein SLS62_002801 [Diatrype stigma]|uniref:PWI domain-containing protein n=1 Tax=Diatrype stigma TaxID=117547 RepID=A0AAN9UU29_9PEZI